MVFIETTPVTIDGYFTTKFANALPVNEIHQLMQDACVSGGETSSVPSGAWSQLEKSHGRNSTKVDQNGQPIVVAIDDDRYSVAVKGLSPGQVGRRFDNPEDFIDPTRSGIHYPFGYLTDQSIDRIIEISKALNKSGALGELVPGYVYPTGEYLDGELISRQEFGEKIVHQAAQMGLNVEPVNTLRQLRLIPGLYRLEDLIHKYRQLNKLFKPNDTAVDLDPDLDIRTELDTIITTAFSLAMANLGIAHNPKTGPVASLGYRHIGNITETGGHVDFDSGLCVALGDAKAEIASQMIDDLKGMAISMQDILGVTGRDLVPTIDSYRLTAGDSYIYAVLGNTLRDNTKHPVVADQLIGAHVWDDPASLSQSIESVAGFNIGDSGFVLPSGDKLYELSKGNHVAAGFTREDLVKVAKGEPIGFILQDAEQYAYELLGDFFGKQPGQVADHADPVGLDCSWLFQIAAAG